MSIKLRELIRNIRTCKTAAEERAVIAKECAAIRTAFREEDSSYRHRNVAKLLFIHMLGYPTHFGQMECLKLIASARFPEKRVGYLGLTQLLDENTEVLMLVTNSIKNDMSAGNQFINGLGICALGNVGTAEMCAALSREIEQMLNISNPYVRKKAALCAMRVCKKCEEMVDRFRPKVRALLEDRNHGVMISGLALMRSIVEQDPANALPEYREQIPHLVRVLKNMLMSGYANAAEYDVAGVTDPFLQCAILKTLRVLGTNSVDASEEMNDILAQVATNTEAVKNIGNSILYETVQTIMAIESESGLRVLAINILGRFLQNRDNNIRYVALAMLQKVVKVDIKSVQRHRQTILECLKDPDVSIQKRALAVLYNLITEENVKATMKELLNFLLVADADVKEELVLKICHCVDRFGPNRRWQIDTLVKVMCLAGNYVQEETRSHFCQIVGSSPPLHEYVAHKVFFSIQENLNQEAMVLTGVWCIGEYGDYLITGKATGPNNEPIKITPAEVLSLLDTIMKKPQYADAYSNKRTTTVLEYCVTALIKLTPRMPNEAAKIREMLKRYETHISPELQQRACEYQELLLPVWNGDRAEVLNRIPAMERIIKKEVGDTAIEEVGSGGNAQGKKTPTKNTASAGDDLLDLLDLGGGSSAPKTSTGAPQAAPKPSGGDDLLDLLGGAAPTPAASSQPMQLAPTAGAPAAPAASGGLDDLLGGGGLLGSSPAGPSGGGVASLGNGLTSLGNGSAGGGNDLLGDLLGGGPSPVMANTPTPAPMISPAATSSTTTPATSSGASSSFVPINKNGLQVKFTCSKQSDQVTRIEACFANQQQAPFTDFAFEVAVPKYLNLKMQPASSATVPPQTANTTQVFLIQNTSNGAKPIAIRTRVKFSFNGQPVTLQDQVDNFPSL
ncbi:unnamed protein product [Amoebophrya sp. A120]|nr:unnamed protein product [Amoebophrya sp. A120]|eukprot:GSA120T00019596001.1